MAEVAHTYSVEE